MREKKIQLFNIYFETKKAKKMWASNEINRIGTFKLSERFFFVVAKLEFFYS